MAFVNFPLFDDCTAFSHLSVLAGNLFLGAYPLPCLVIKYASGGNLYIGLGKQLPFTEDKVDVVVGLFLVMMESRYTFHIVPSVKFLCEIFKHLLRLMGGLNFGQGDDKLPCFNTPSQCAASVKFLLTFFCEITPKGIVCGSVGGIGVLLSCVACNIRYSSLDIGQLRHLNEAVSCHSLLSAVLGCSHFVTDLSVAAVPMVFDRGTATENCGVIFSVSIEGCNVRY